MKTIEEKVLDLTKHNYLSREKMNCMEEEVALVLVEGIYAVERRETLVFQNIREENDLKEKGKLEEKLKKFKKGPGSPQKVR